MPSDSGFGLFLSTVRVRVDAALDDYLPRAPLCPPVVADAMRYSVFAGGKRLRPTLALAAADAVARRAGAVRAPDGFSGPMLDALPAACAIEMIHTYSLTHDDLPAMDDDTLRRGRPTSHVVYGEGIAILAGDGLHAEAFALLAREPKATEPARIARKLRAIGAIADAAGAAGMVGGQAVDLQAAGRAHGPRLELDADRLRDMHARKTGALIRASAVAGGVMAGADEALVGALDGYAAEIGLAFQIVDDLLDVEGSAEQLGKTAGKDAADRKPTYPALFGVERSRILAAECIGRAHARLATAGLADGWLGAIADWILHRTS